MACGSRNLHELPRRIPEIPRIEAPYRLDGESRPAIATKFQPKDAALQRVGALQRRKLRKMQEGSGKRPEIDAGRPCAAHDASQMFRRIIHAPSRAIDPFPFRPAHLGM